MQSIIRTLSGAGWILLWICILGVPVLAQTVTGSIRDVRTGAGLAGATVELAGEYTVSGPDGRFEIALAGTYGRHELLVTYIGYIDHTRQLVLNQDTVIGIEVLMTEKENILGTTTISAGRYERPIGEVTVSLEVIRPQLIQSLNTTALDQVLQKMPGVDVIDGQANIRGGSGYSYGAGSRVLLLLDDIPVLQADAGFPNWNDLPVENIGQIEIVKGASSVLYGSSALNGVINVLTAHPGERPETHVATYYTHYMDPADPAKKWWGKAPYEAGVSLQHKQRWQKLDLVLSGMFRDLQSFNEETFERYGRLNAQLRYRIHDRLTAGVRTNINRGAGSSFFFWQDAEAGAYRPAPNVLSESDRLRFTVDPYVTWFDRSGNRHKVLGRFYAVDNNNNENRSNRSALYYGEYQFLRRFSRIPLVLTGGVVTQSSRIEAELYGDTIFTSANLAAYMQLDLTVFKRFNISGGVRLEHNTQRSPEAVLDFIIPGGLTEETRPVYRLGANYQLADYTYLRASYGQGYRYPTIAERFINTPLGPVFVFPNPVLRSETGWTSELGYKQGLKLGEWMGYLDIAAFWQEYADMMEFVFTATPQGFGFQSQNVGPTRIRGLDLNISGSGDIRGWQTTVLAGYTYLDPRYRDFSEADSLTSSARRNILKYRFRHTLKVDIESGPGRWKLGVAIWRYSYMENIDAILEELVVAGLKEYRSENNRGTTLADIRASYDLLPGLRLALICRNLFNREYSMRPGVLDAPRNITLRADYRF